MIRIAFLSFDWHYEVINHYYEGILQYVDDHEDVSVCIFHGLGKYDNEEPEAGSFDIFELPDFSKFDGVILQGNRAWPSDKRQKVANKAIAAGAHVASINYPLKGAIYIGTDNYGAMKTMTEHILDRHGISNPVFVEGLETSEEAQYRKEGFLSACKEHNIRDPKTYPGGWDRKDGVRVAKQILQEYGKYHPPGAIVCCSDELALGVIRTLMENQIPVPEKVLVTGFDNRRFAALGFPRISSVDRDYEEIGYTTIRALCSKINGLQTASEIYCPCRTIFSETCGCQETANITRKVKEDLSEMNSALKKFYRKFDEMETGLFDAKNLYDLFETMEEHADMMNLRHMYLVMNDTYLNSFKKHTGPSKYGDTVSLVANGGNKENLSCDENHVYESFSPKEILPKKYLEQDRFHVVYPIRDHEDMIGYLVTDGLYIAEKFNFHKLFLMTITRAIETVLLKEQLEKK